MRKTGKKLALIVLAGALAVGGAFAGYAANLGNGQWCTGVGPDAGKYWFAIQPDGKKFIANTWHWVKDSDGQIYCYYFDQNGWVVTNTTIDGEQVDANGRWVKNGKPVTATSDAEKDFYTHSNAFLSGAQTPQSSKEQQAGSTTQPAANTKKTNSSTATKTGSTAKKGVVKGSGKGDDPSGAEADALGYSISNVSGKDISNSWANFKLSAASVDAQIEVGTAETGMDFYINAGAELTARFIPLDKYKAGNTDLNAFIASFIADPKEGMKGAAVAADVQLGAYNFKQASVKEPNPTPSLTLMNNAYFRVVDGTNYAQVITVQHNGEAQDFLTMLNTIQKVR